MKIKNIAIIGAGLQCKRRIPAITSDPGCKITWIIDIVSKRAEKFAHICHARFGTDWRQAVYDSKVDAVLVLTYPDSHASISIAAMENGKDVLCEKPLSRILGEARDIIETAQSTKRIIKCGFNHRFHPAVMDAYKLLKSNEFGKLIFGRGCYGIAGRKGLEKEWRSDPKIVGGGQLMEQGIHLVDLFRWFLGDIVKVTGMVGTNYWPISPLEDNGFAVLQNKEGVIASIHASLTQWINLFEFEIYCEKGSLTVTGLGESYGVEKLIISKHNGVKPFSYKTIEFRGHDKSWKNEWEEFTRAIEKRIEPNGNARDGYKAMEIVNAVYTSSRVGKIIRLR